MSLPFQGRLEDKDVVRCGIVMDPHGANAVLCTEDLVIDFPRPARASNLKFPPNRGVPVRHQSHRCKVLSQA